MKYWMSGRWHPRNVIFAAEGNPLDLYRTVLRIDNERTAVFQGSGRIPIAADANRQ